MNPIDLRNETWESLQKYLTGMRLAVLHAYRTHGPCTTRELANRIEMDLLTVRPRTTELLELGMLRLVGRRESEGVYEYIPAGEAREMFLAARDGRRLRRAPAKTEFDEARPTPP